MSPPTGKWVNVASVVIRWALGCIFIYTGLEKGLDPVAFLKLVRQYELFQTPWLLNSVAAALPWFEVFCGVLLLWFWLSARARFSFSAN